MARKKIDPMSTDLLVRKSGTLDQEVLDTILGADKRLLWAFVRNKDGDTQAVPYSEDRVIWLAESDVLQPRDVEL